MSAYSKDTLLDLHAKRVVRSGKQLWQLVKTLPTRNSILSGEDAMKIKDSYGLRPSDVIFLCASHNCEIDLDSFVDLLNKENQKQSLLA